MVITNRKKHSLVIAAAMLIALSLRLYVYFYMSDHSFHNALMFSEPTGYMNEAENIVNGGEWFMGVLNGHYQLLTVHPKGYSVLLALFMKLFGSGWLTAVHLLMLFLDVLVCLLLDLTINEVFKNQSAGIAAAFLWALNPLAIMNCIQDLPDGFSGILAAWILWLYYRQFGSELKRGLILGFAIAIAVYFRAEFMLILVLILFSDWINSQDLKASLKSWIYSLLAFLLVMSPWLIYSGIKSGHPMISSQNAWGSAYEAIGEYPDNAWGIIRKDEFVDAEAYEHGFDGAWTYDANQYYKKKFLDYVKENPSEYLYIVVRYRLPKAFIPVSFAYFNMNRAGNGNTFRVSTFCNHQGSLKNLCTVSFTYAALLEGKGGRLISWILFACMIAFLIRTIQKKRFRKTSFIFFLWLYFPLMISALKQIEPRNVFPAEVPLTIGTAMILTEILSHLSKRIHKELIISASRLRYNNRLGRRENCIFDHSYLHP